jgi:uncharacterized membrane protein
MATSTLSRGVRSKPISKPSLGAESGVEPTARISEPVEAKQITRNWPMALGLAVVLILGAAIVTLLGAESTAVKAGAVLVAALIELGIASMASR